MPPCSQNDSPLTTASALSLIHFMHIAERLKDELRHSYTSGGKQESVAEHCWRVALLALLMKPYLPGSLDWERLLEMLIVHDLAEAKTGDVPIFDSRHGTKSHEERSAMNGYRELLPEAVWERISHLWEEYEARQTPESRIANALDKLEAQIQHNEADLTTWLEWEKNRVLEGLFDIRRSDPSVSTLTEAIVQEAQKKLGVL